MRYFATALPLALLGCTASPGRAADPQNIAYPSYGIIVHSIDVPEKAFEGGSGYLNGKYVYELFERLQTDAGPVKAALDKLDPECDPDDFCPDDPGWAYAGIVELWSGLFDHRGWSGGYAGYRYFLTYTAAGTAQGTEPVLALDVSERVDVVTDGDLVHVQITTRLEGMGPLPALPTVPGVAGTRIIR